MNYDDHYDDAGEIDDDDGVDIRRGDGCDDNGVDHSSHVDIEDITDVVLDADGGNDDSAGDIDGRCKRRYAGDVNVE